MNVNLYGCRGQWIMVDLGLTFADPDYPGHRPHPARPRVHRGAAGAARRDRPDPRPRGPYRRAALSRRGAEGAALRDAVHRRPDRRQARGRGADRPGQAQHRRARRERSSSGRSRSASSRCRTRSPRATALLIETPFGNVFHTGDWKIDETPVLGEAPSTEALTAIGDEGVLALVCDSTNVFQDKPSGSEESVHAGPAGAGRRRPRAGCSSPPSPPTPRGCRRSAASRRKPAARCASPAARSSASCASPRRPAICKDFPPPIGFDEAMRLPRSEVLIIATGGQGEPRAALGRIAVGTHELKLGEGDTVIFSSRIIPGNEVAIGRIMNQLSDLGVQIVTERQAHVHVSGHPGRPELIEMYNWVRPRDRRSGPWRGAAPRRACAAGARPRRRARRRAEERRRDPPRARRAEEGRRGARRPAGARRRRHPARRRRDDQRAAADRLTAG